VLGLNLTPAKADRSLKLTVMTSKPRASSNASGSTTIRNIPARSANATPIPPVKRASTSILSASVSSRRISVPSGRVVTSGSPSVVGSARVPRPVLSFTTPIVEPLKNETPPRTRVASMTLEKSPSLSRSPSSSSHLSSSKSPSISLTTPSPQANAKSRSLHSFIATTPPKFILNNNSSSNTENSSTTTPSKQKPILSSNSTNIKPATPKRVPNTPGSKTGSPAQKSSLGRKSGSALLADGNTLVLSRKPALTSSNGTGTIVATDDGWLGGGGGGIGDAFWDGEDMSLEMVTDVNDGDVDEEVKFFFFPTVSLTFATFCLSSPF
jgi:pyrimidine and pyridine-specific 5'-nucleotidase